jgi:hypothetical protein
MMDFASTQARAKGVTPTASREEGHTEAATARPQKPHLRPLLMGWIGYTANWWRSTPSPLCNWRTMPAGVGLT